MDQTLFTSTYAETHMYWNLKKSASAHQKRKPTLSATDVLAPTTMKNAAKCDTSCELQNPVSHQNFERNLHFFGSMSVGVSVHPNLWAQAPSVNRLGVARYPDEFRWIFTTELDQYSTSPWRVCCWGNCDVNFYRNIPLHTLWYVTGSNLFGPPISQDYPLNLSILLGGGKETNKDSLSNGEWSGKSSDVKSSELSSGEARSQGRQSLLERSALEGDSPVYAPRSSFSFLRVELFGIAALSGW